MSILKFFGLSLSIFTLCVAIPTVSAQSYSERPSNSEALLVEDTVVGTGPTAANGDTVIVKYVGKLTNGKEFDSTKGDQTFAFVLGQGKVIKGWDQGILGMQKDGVRKLTIPPSLGYGNRAVGSIPPNSTLVFDVTLVKLVKK